MEHCHDSLKAQPGYLPAHLLLGKLWADQGKLTECVAQYEEAARLVPRAASQVYLELAAILAANKDLIMAETYLRKVEQADPDNTDLACKIAQLYQECGLVNDAKRVSARCQATHQPTASP